MVDPAPKPAPALENLPRPTDVHARILQEAVRLFGTIGYEATSLQSIAEAVGIRKPSLLYHFSSKEELHRQVIESSLEHWRMELPRVLAKSLTGYDRFDSAMTALLDFFRSDPNRAKLTMREMLDRPDALRERLTEHLSPWIKILTEYIRMGQKSGLIKPDLHPESYVVQVLLMVMSTAAVGDVAAALAGTRNPGQDERDKAELVRIAREAVFVDPGAKTGRA